MPADKFGCRMYHNICAIFNRPNQIRCSKGIINDKRKPMCMCNFCNCRNINHIGIGISKRFNENQFGIFLYCICKALRI